MKLYSKNLSSMAELEREKRRLLKEKNLLEDEEFFSLGEVMAEAKGIGLGIVGGKLPMVSGIVSRLLPFAGGIAGPLAGIAQRWFSGRSKHSDHSEDDAEPGEESGVKKALKSAAREFIGSYLKWKALELSYKGLTFIIKKQQKKKRLKGKA